jgi:hypothetical protein
MDQSRIRRATFKGKRSVEHDVRDREHERGDEKRYVPTAYLSAPTARRLQRDADERLHRDHAQGRGREADAQLVDHA